MYITRFVNELTNYEQRRKFQFIVVNIFHRNNPKTKAKRKEEQTTHPKRTGMRCLLQPEIENDQCVLLIYL